MVAWLRRAAVWVTLCALDPAPYSTRRPWRLIGITITAFKNQELLAGYCIDTCDKIVERRAQLESVALFVSLTECTVRARASRPVPPDSGRFSRILHRAILFGWRGGSTLVDDGAKLRPADPKSEV
jgi:hypothetical protein